MPDETPPDCTVDDAHGHDINPGCDSDPRSSTPLHLGDELAALLRQYPNAITYVAGHTHEQSLSEFSVPGARAASGASRRPR